MSTLWFILLGAMIAAYVVLDGFDLGVGALHFALGRTADERTRIASAIGPIWNGNEVWLIASGGLLLFAFPKVYSGALSGLYFGLIIVLWLLIGRGLALELRHHLDHPLWHQACDAVFCVASAALSFVLGVALGNVVRGVPLGSDGYFALPLFQTLNWYALLIGLMALIVTSAQGASFLAARADGELGARASVWARWLVRTEAVTLIAMIGPTYAVRHHMLNVFADHPWALVFPLAMAVALSATLVWQSRGSWLASFVGHSAAVAGVLATMAAGLYPYMLPARQGRAFGLTIDNASAGSHALSIGLVWFPVAMLLAIAYFTYAYRLLFRSPPS